MPNPSPLFDDPAQFAQARRTMVDCQIRTFDVTDQRLLARLLEVPREAFLPAELAPLAYSDLSLTVNAGGRPRMLLSPLVLARLIQDAGVKQSDNVLDVGPATGYSSALLAGLVGRVTALESDSNLYKSLRSNLDSIGLTEVKTVLGPLENGAAQEGPFDLICIQGAAEAHLDKLFGQLKIRGRLVAFKALASHEIGHASQAVRYEKIDGGLGFRVLFDAAAPRLDAFRQTAQFTFF
ncbi:MAG: protein-L-isoaspartate O-methyltransferase [Alphaproteobacteria bacterium]|nr:protein-L-isoaspartate O-methyltransferase [Alphaproteobacteria bacterium]